MTGFEPRISGVGSDRSTNWATTTAQIVVVVSTDLEYLNACSQMPQNFLKLLSLSLSLESQWLIALSESGIGRNEI